MDMDRILKFFLVVCCFINAFSKKGGLALGEKDYNLLRVGMGLTVIADLLMVIMDINVFGILAFCAVQAVYNYRYTNLSRVKVQAIVGAVVFIAALLFSKFDIIFASGCAYGIFVLYSLTGAFMARGKYPMVNSSLIIIGMILFLACDIFVMISSLPILELYGEGVLDFVLKGIWICYLPAQVLLSSSARRILTEDNL